MKSISLILLLAVMFSCNKDKSVTPEAKPAPLKTIEITNYPSKIKAGDHFKIEYKLSPSNTFDSSISWTSSDPTIAEVDGLDVYALKEGSCQIIGKSKVGAVEVKIDLTIEYLYIQSIEFVEQEYTFTLGQHPAYLTFYSLPERADRSDVTFSISPESVAKINNHGDITPVSIGEAIVTATAKGGHASATCKVKIVPIYVNQITFDKQNISLEVGEKLQVTATVNQDATNKRLIWSSGNTKVAAVDQTGLITAVGIGTASILVRSEDGNYSTYFLVRIVDIPYYLKISPSYTITAYNSETGMFTGTVSSTIKNNSSYDVRLTSYEIRELGTNTVLYKNNFSVLLKPGQDVGSGTSYINNKYKPYQVWYFTSQGESYSKDEITFH